MKRRLLLFVMLVLPMLASADAVEINGIYYNLVSKANQAEVTSHASKYSGSVVIPETIIYEEAEYTVTSIGDYAFSACKDLTSVTVPNSVTTIGDAAFQGCSGLTSITLSNNVTAIGGSTFYDCSGLSSITIPNSVTRIGGNAFKNCSGLTSITIPSSVTSIDNNAFANCSGLTSITIPSSVTSIESHAFSGCSSLTSITIPNSVTSIEWSVFQNCSGLTSVTIPNSVTAIGEAAFKDCSGLASVTIGTGVKSIGSGAFAKCPELKNVHCLAENVPRTNSDVFEGSYIEYATLHVSEGSVIAYSNEEPWKNFKSIVGINGGDEAQKCATPTISYGGKKLTFACETEGVEYVSEIMAADVKNYYNSTIDLTATYEISVYATKPGYTNSDVATATLVWTSGSFTETTPATGILSASINDNDVPVLIQSNHGVLTIECATDGTQVGVYGMDGTQIGSATIQNGQVSIATNLQSGSVAIVKVGQKSVKIIVK